MEILNANLKFDGQLIPLDLENVKYIVIHHAEAPKATPDDIHAWHLQNGWIGAGYNAYIRKDGTVYIMRGDNVGAHALNYNQVSYGICCEGNYDDINPKLATDYTMPDAQFNSLVNFVAMQHERFPDALIVKHSDLCATVCPGKYFPMEEMIDSLPKDHWAKQYRDTLIRNGITIDEERYDDAMTRGEAFALICKALKLI
jgi:hypothetical protein